MSLIELSFIVLCSVSSVVAGLAFIERRRTDATPATLKEDGALHFLFRGLDLEHASQGAEAIIGGDVARTDWDAIRENLSVRFTGLPDEENLQDVDQLTLFADQDDDHAVIQLEREGEMTRLKIMDESADDVRFSHKVKSLESKLNVLQLATDSAPYPIWLSEEDGGIAWSNDAYQRLLEAMETDADQADPIPFFTAAQDILPGRTRRLSVQNQKTDSREWYSVTATEDKNRTVFHAVNIDAVIQAEVAQRNFVQTLAKTFAQLSIGLAIFDRNGQLALFNPALLDLTSLPAEFLSARPDLLSFFDKLRDNRVMPEPKNYLTWRQEISNMIAAANNGSYQETWTLDSGHTYRVMGRPHPDGAVAFLIEDISAEISLTRNFRAELELGQSLMDTLDDALVVFSSVGILTFCNAAYSEMWGLDPNNTFADITIIDSLKEWQSQCDPNPAWGDMRDFAMKVTDRATWSATVCHRTKGTFTALVAPVASGATVIRFTETITPQTPVEVL